MKAQTSMLLILFWSILIFRSLLAQCPEPGNANQIINPGFEQVAPPCPTSWGPPPFQDAAFNQGCVPGWFSAWATPSVCNNGPNTGAVYACLGLNNEAIFTNISLCEATYELRLFTKRISGSGSGFLDVYLANGLQNINPGNSGFPPLPINPSWQLLQAITVNGPWVQTIINFTVLPGNINNQLLMVLRGNVDIGIDDVFLSACEVDYLEEISCEKTGSNAFSFEATLNNAGQQAEIDSYCWDFGDGSTIVSNSLSVNHMYSQEGTFTVCVSSIDECGCISQVCTEIVNQNCSCNCSPNNELPVVANPPPGNIQLICANNIPAPEPLIVSLECGQPIILFSETISGNGCVLQIERSWDVNNPCGEGLTFNQTVTVNDNTPPQFTSLPQNVAIPCTGDFNAFFNWLANNGNGEATDNCSDVIWQASYDQSQLSNCGTVEVTFMIFDECGLENSHVASFRYEDTEAPEASNPPLPFVQVSCASQIPPGPVLNVLDNCSESVTQVFNEIQDGNPCNLEIIRIWVLEDECQNVQTYEQIILVIDQESPILTQLPRDTLVDCGANVSSIFNQWLTNNGGAEAIDNCETLLWNAAYNADPDSVCSITTVVFSVSDACGNSTTASANFIVDDNIAPIFTILPRDTIVNCAVNRGQIISQWLLSNGGGSASDNCGAVTWLNNFDGDTTLLDNLIVFEATDLCNNRATASARISFSPGIDTTFNRSFTCNINEIRSDTLIWQINGCDSVVISSVEWLPSDTTRLNLSACGALEISVDSLILSNSAGCDSLVITTIVPLPNDTIFIQRSICAPEPERIDTLWFVNMQGCDSIVFVQFSLQNTDTTRLEEFRCNLPDIQIDTLVLQGLFCDSIVLMQLNPAPSDTITQERIVCNQSEEGRDTLFLTNRFGCDSLLITHSRFLPPDSTLIVIPTCDSLAVGSDELRLQNQFGCDSIVITSRILAEFTFSERFEQLCGNGENYIDTLRFQGSICDSFEFVYYTYIAPDTTQLEEFSCLISDVGEFVEILINQQGCDSIIFRRVSLLTSSETNIFLETCIVDEAGVFIDTLRNVFGCDSIVKREVQLLVSDTTEVRRSSCNPMEVGEFIVQETNIAGCDSIIRIITTLQSADTTLFQAVDCELIVPRRDTIILLNSSGCDSLLIFEFIPDPFPLLVDLGPDRRVQEGSFIEIDARITGTYNALLWSPSSIFSCAECTSQRILANSEITVELNVISANGCVYSDSMFIYITDNRLVFIPSAFTPDNDGINDRFTVFGGPLLKLIKALSIFDRWGNRVYIGENLPPNDPRYGWDGSFRGTNMDPAVFAFVAIVEFEDGTEKTFFGEMSLLR
jgi:gliding motility-associated-like protein